MGNISLTNLRVTSAYRYLAVFFFLLLLFKFLPVFELCVRFFYYNFSLSLSHSLRLSLSRCAMSVRQNNIGVPFGRVQYRVEVVCECVLR